eukprot:12540419-Alexandrium_andersonii.AAC.1
MDVIAPLGCVAQTAVEPLANKRVELKSSEAHGVHAVCGGVAFDRRAIQAALPRMFGRASLLSLPLLTLALLVPVPRPSSRKIGASRPD